MNKKNYLEQLHQLCDAARPIHDEEADNILKTAKNQLESEHIPTAMCICTNSNRQLFDLPSAFGLDWSKNQKQYDLVRSFADFLLIEHGENSNLYVIQNDFRIPASAVLDSEPTESQRKYPMIMTLPDEPLSHYRLILCSDLSAVQPEFIGSEIDLVCLKTNATMAMTQEERTWIKNVLLPWHGRVRFKVWVDMLERLNTDEDVSTVIDHVRKILDQFELPVQNITSSSQLADWVKSMITNQSELSELREAQIFENCSRQLNEYIEDEIANAQVDIDLVQRAKSQIERQHKSLELAGQIASNTVVKNEYENLKFRLLNDLERYCKEAGDICIREIQNSTDIHETADAVQRYLDGAWRQYQLEANRIIQKENEGISERLLKRMEMDAGELIGQLDQDVQMLLGRAMQLNTNFRSASGLDWEAGQQALKRETRNIMLLSVPLLLVDPTWSVAALVGSQIYKKYKSNVLDSRLHAQIEDDVQRQCKQAQESISDSLSSGLEQAAKESEEYVQTAYNNLSDTLRQKLDELIQSCDTAKDRVENLSTLQSRLQTVE